RHTIVHLGDLRVWLIGMRHQLQLDDPGPLDVLVTQLMGLWLILSKETGIFDAGNHEVTKLLALSIKRADMPTQPVINQCKGHNLAFRFATRDRVILDAQSAF